MPRVIPIYLATLRKQFGLTQEELSLLLTISTSALSRFESRERRPTVDLVIGSEVVFGNRTKEVFPGLYGEVEDRVMARAKVLYARLEARTDLSSQEKLKLLRSMISRAEATDPGL